MYEMDMIFQHCNVYFMTIAFYYHASTLIGLFGVGEVHKLYSQISYSSIKDFIIWANWLVALFSERRNRPYVWKRSKRPLKTWLLTSLLQRF